MKTFRTIGCAALLFTLFFPELVLPACCKVICTTPGQKATCMDCQSENPTCWCGNPTQQKKMVSDFIQAKEGVDRSKIINLDEVLQKVVEESSQKVDTPVNFTVKVQRGENTPPKEVEYQIETSR